MRLTKRGRRVLVMTYVGAFAFGMWWPFIWVKG